MRALVSASYGFVQEKVESPDTGKITPDISFHKGLVTLIIVVLAEVAAMLCIFFFVVPPNTLLSSIRNVNASMALQRPAECYEWTDSTAYGTNGILVANWGPGPIYTSKPLLGKDIKALVANLTCTPPGPTTGSAMVGYVQLLGYTSITGQTQHVCTDPNRTITVNPVSVSLDQSCLLVRDHVLEVYGSLLSARAPHTDEYPQLWGVECATFPQYTTFSMSFRWTVTDNLPFTVDLAIQCSSMTTASLMATLAKYGIKQLPPEAAALLNSSTPQIVCLRLGQDNSTCAVGLLRDNACAVVPYVGVFGVGQIDCTNAPKYSSGPCPSQVQQQYNCPQNANSTCQPYAFSDLPEFVQDLSVISELATTVLSPNFCDNVQLVAQCPGASYPLSDLLTFFRDAMKFLGENLQDYDQRAAFTFTCTVSTPPEWQTRLSYILPYCNIVHTVALTYLVRYIYKLLRMTESLRAKRAAAGAGSEADDEESQKEPPLPDHVKEHLQILEDVYPTSGATPRCKANSPYLLPQPAETSRAP